MMSSDIVCRSAFYRGAQAVKKRHLRRLKFSSGDFFRKEARLIDFWKFLVFG